VWDVTSKPVVFASPHQNKTTELSSCLTNIVTQKDFLEEHPGGAKIILQYAGSDATAAYDQYHLPNVVEETLSAAAKLGRIEPDSMAQTTSSVTSQPNSSSSNMTKTQAVRPPLDSILNLDDIEKTAEKCLAPNAWAYYASAADDELSKDNNRRAYQKVTIRPRLLRDVSSIDTRTAILGYPCSLPIFVSPAAMAKLAHPEGECAIAAGVGAEDLIQVASTSSSWPIEKIMEARVHKDQPVFFQLYVHKDRQRAETLSRKAERAGAKALWVTIDTPVMGKRERDERVMATIQVG
jgi:L-lactate dehydrogenase (cytochrome)